MNIADQIMRRADRAFAEASGRTLIEDLSPMERKAIEDDMERKARYVRTPAGVRRFKRPIGAIILPGGIGSLDKIRIKDPVFKGFDLVEDRKGNLYDIGKDPASGGKYVVLKHNTWDDQVEPQDSLDKALVALNEKLGGGTNSDREEGEKPAPKAKKPAPKKTPGEESSSDSKPQSSAPSKGNTSTAEIVDGKFVITTPDGKKHTRTATGKKPYTHALIRKNKEGSGSDRYFVNFATDEGKVHRESRIGAADRAHNEIIELPTSGNDAPSTPEPQGDAPASDDNVASSDPRKRSAKFKRAADNMDRALDAVDNAKTEDDYRRALVDLEKSTVEMEDYIKSKGSEEDFARSALPKIERAKAKARSQIKRMEAKRKDQAGAGARDKSKAVTRDTPIGTQVRVSGEGHGNAGATGQIVRRNKNGVTIKGKDGTFSAPYDALETTSKADGKRIEAAQGASKDLDLLDRQASGLQKTMDRMEKASTLDELNELDRDFTVQRARQRVKADEIIKNPRTSDEDRKRAQDAKDRVSKLDDDEIALLERKKKELSAPKKAKPTSIGTQGSKERDAFIESHPKIKDVTDYHKPKLRDMSEKNFEAYVAAVEGGKSPNSVGPIMDRIDAGASWNPVTEKWVGQNGKKRPTSPTPTGDTSASDAADAAVRDRVEKMKASDRSKGRTNPYTSSLTPSQKREVDALTPGEYAKYMNRRDAGDGHHKAVSEARGGQSTNAVADDAARNQKNREARESAEQDSRFGNTATFVSANQDLIKKIVSLGRSGKDPYPHISEARARLAEIDKRLSWTDDELGGYHKGKGKAESDERAAQFRESLQSQRTNYEKAINLMEDLKAKRSKPKGGDKPVGDQHQDMGEIERIGREAREKARKEREDRERQRAEDRETMRQHERANFERAPFRKAWNAFKANEKRLREKDEPERVRNNRLKAMEESIKEREMRLATERYSGNLFERDRTSYQASIDRDKKTLEEVRALVAAKPKDKPLEDYVPPSQRDKPSSSGARASKQYGDAPLAADGLPVQTSKSSGSRATGDYIPALPKGNQKTYVITSPDGRTHLDNTSRASTHAVVVRESDGSWSLHSTNGSEAAARKVALTYSNRNGVGSAQVVPSSPREAAQQSQSTSSGTPSASAPKSFDAAKRVVDRKHEALNKEILDFERTGGTQAWLNKVATVERLTALQKQVRDLRAEVDRDLDPSAGGGMSADYTKRSILQDLDHRDRMLQMSLDRSTASDKAKERARAKAGITSGTPSPDAPKVTPSRPRETSSPAPTLDRVKGADSTVSLAKMQALKARRARTEKSARDHINVLNGAERDLNRTLERSGDRMPADQRAEVEQALQEVRAARAKAEQNIPLSQRTTLRPSDIPALNEQNSQNRDYREVARNRATAEAQELFNSLPTSIPDGTRYGAQELDRAALANMDDAPSVPALNRAIRALEEQEDTTVDDEIRVLKEARDYLKERADRERAEFESANTSLFGDDLSIPESRPAGQSEDRTNKTAISIGNFGVRSETEARQMYANTPRRDIADIPKGGNGHIGNGIWVKRCPVCGQAFKSVGAPGYSATYARHVDGHNTGAAIPGYNTGMMS